VVEVEVAKLAVQALLEDLVAVEAMEALVAQVLLDKVTTVEWVLVLNQVPVLEQVAVPALLGEKTIPEVVQD
jgi:hypothetical protein